MATFKAFNPLGAEPGKIKETPESRAYWQSVKPAGLVKTKNPHYDLKKHYSKTIELATVVSLVLVLFSFLTLRNFETEAQQITSSIQELIVEEIPVTEQLRKLTAPPRPAVPLPSDDEDIADDETIDDTDINFAEIPPPPEKPVIDDAEDIFVVFDTPPKPVGGYQSIYERIVYPEVAKMANIEGSVVLRLLITPRGEVERAEVIKDSGSDVGFEKAALAAVDGTKWSPAMQRDRAVKVWVSVPIRFALTNLSS
ncbi:MAG: energy transducer TonB [Deferribacteres bacterium]|nr:energy transducer TonB [candidate division KSB1 bacterium]MCB9503674.1 energy transducer TonB [Deferribacteres bacterium]